MLNSQHEHQKQDQSIDADRLEVGRSPTGEKAVDHCARVASANDGVIEQEVTELREEVRRVRLLEEHVTLHLDHLLRNFRQRQRPLEFDRQGTGA